MNAIVRHADAFTIATLSKILKEDLTAQTTQSDLQSRLAAKGFAVDGDYLVTTPHGQRVCEMDRL